MNRSIRPAAGWLGMLTVTVGICLAAMSGSVMQAAAEPNDTPAGASGPIQSGRMYESAIETENDRDWWVFYSGGSTQINAALWGRGPDDCFGPVMSLKDASGQFLGDRAGPAGTSTSVHILYTVGPGIYYLEVAPYNVSPCIGPDARYMVWINSSLALLTAPPVIPPPPPPPVTTQQPPSPVRASPCDQARARLAALVRKLRQAQGRPNYQYRLRIYVKRARVKVAQVC